MSVVRCTAEGCRWTASVATSANPARSLAQHVRMMHRPRKPAPPWVMGRAPLRLPHGDGWILGTGSIADIARSVPLQGDTR